MKKLFGVFAAVSLLFALVSCAQISSNPVAKGETSSQQDENQWGITLSAEDVTPTGMTLVCTQSGGTVQGSLETGSPFTIEQVVDGVWLPVETKPGLDWAWTMEAWLIQQETTTKWAVDWSFLYGSLEPGDYRISKEIREFRAPGDYTSKICCAEFKIVD